MLFFIISMIEYICSLINTVVGNHEAAWKCVVLGSLFLSLYYLTYIFLRVREFEKFVNEVNNKIKTEGSDTVDERF